MRSKFHAFDGFNYALLAIIALLTLYPFWYVLVISVSTEKAFYSDVYHLWPSSFSLATYQYALTNELLFRSLLISTAVTAMGLALSMLLTSIGAYALSKKTLKGRKPLFLFILFTMFFNGGIVPLYVLVNQLGMQNTLFAMFVPAAMNTFNLILMMNYFSEMPESLEEAARMDGCGEWRVLFRVVLPTAKPIAMTIMLFYGVFYWNDWFFAMLFMSDQTLYPLPLFLRNLVLSSQSFMAAGLSRQVPEMIKATVIVISIVPVLAVYPFVQKHFVQGIMLGSVKE
jgi:putative aldouronate transport system permease protein